MNELFDSHCHIHWPNYKIKQDLALANGRDAGVRGVICVGTDYLDSQIAVEFAKTHQNVWASVGLHPHDAKLGSKEIQKLKSLIGSEKVVAIGECGLDYYYNKSPKNDQLKILRQQIELALENNLPIIFHVREAFEDLWPVFDDYQDIKGVFHSFTASRRELGQILDRGLYVGLNGIITFSKVDSQLDAAKVVPLDRLLLETDAPFLSPVPKRGQTNEPANVKYIAQFLSDLRGESLELLSDTTTKNTKKLFAI
jgi:TatD DNase family protein